jgi:drug/metabolite transporter (DMT)-like permease
MRLIHFVRCRLPKLFEGFSEAFTSNATSPSETAMITPNAATDPSATNMAIWSGQTPELRGMLLGAAAVLMWGSYLAFARAGVSVGLTGFDFTAIRYGTAGLVMLPWLLRHQPATMSGIGWRRALCLMLVAGPIFIWLGVGGYAFAPLAHGAVVQPATIVIGSTILAAVILKDRPDLKRLIGIAVIVIGLAVIAGPALLRGGTLTPIGDGMFVLAGLLWASFTTLTRRWGIKALPATAAVSVLSGVIVLPVYATTIGFDRLLALPTAILITQIIVQGVLSGVLAVIAYTRAAELLGPAKAAIFPALVPAAAIVIGIPVVDELPTMLQLGGLVLVSLGLFVAIGILKLPYRAGS